MIDTVNPSNFGARFKSTVSAISNKSLSHVLTIKPLTDGTKYLWDSNVPLWSTERIEHGAGTISLALTQKLLARNITKIEFKNASELDVAGFFSKLYFDDKIVGKPGIKAYGKKPAAPTIEEKNPEAVVKHDEPQIDIPQIAILPKEMTLAEIIENTTNMVNEKGKAKLFLEEGILTLNRVQIKSDEAAEILHRSSIKRIFFRSSDEVSPFFKQLIQGGEFVNFPSIIINHDDRAWLDNFLKTKPIKIERMAKLIQREIMEPQKSILNKAAEQGYNKFRDEINPSKKLAYSILGFILYCKEANPGLEITKSFLEEVFGISDVEPYQELLKTEGFGDPERYSLYSFMEELSRKKETDIVKKPNLLEGAAKLIIEKGCRTKMTAEGERLFIDGEEIKFPDSEKIAKVMRECFIETVTFNNISKPEKIYVFFDNLLNGKEYPAIPGLGIVYNEAGEIQHLLSQAPLGAERIKTIIMHYFYNLCRSSSDFNRYLKTLEKLYAFDNTQKQTAYLILLFKLYCSQIKFNKKLSNTLLANIFGLQDIKPYLEILQAEELIKEVDKDKFIPARIYKYDVEEKRYDLFRFLDYLRESLPLFQT